MDDNHFATPGDLLANSRTAAIRSDPDTDYSHPYNLPGWKRYQTLHPAGLGGT